MFIVKYCFNCRFSLQNLNSFWSLQRFSPYALSLRKLFTRDLFNAYLMAPHTKWMSKFKWFAWKYTPQFSIERERCINEPKVTSAESVQKITFQMSDKLIFVSNIFAHIGRLRFVTCIVYRGVQCKINFPLSMLQFESIRLVPQWEIHNFPIRTHRDHFPQPQYSPKIQLNEYQSIVTSATHIGENNTAQIMLRYISAIATQRAFIMNGVIPRFLWLK